MNYGREFHGFWDGGEHGDLKWQEETRIVDEDVGVVQKKSCWYNRKISSHSQKQKHVQFHHVLPLLLAPLSKYTFHCGLYLIIN